MKFRPQVQLRFRSEQQYTDAKMFASNAGLSLNEWLLVQVETMKPGISGEVATAPEPKKVKPKAKATEKAEGYSGCGECGALNGAHQRGCSKGRK